MPRSKKMKTTLLMFKHDLLSTISNNSKTFSSLLKSILTINTPSTIVTILISFLITTADLLPILDGRISPIYLDDRYTFSDGEWARGPIFFNDGFDLPLNGTIHLSLDGGAVTGSIKLNGGTVIIEKGLRFEGDGCFSPPGYIRTKNTDNPVYIYHVSIEERFFVGSGRVKFYGPFILHALAEGSSIDQLGGCVLDLSESPSNFYIVGGTLWLRNIKTSNTNPPAIFFYSVNIATVGNQTINSPFLYFSGSNFITSLGLFKIQNLHLIESAKITMYPKTRIQLKSLDIPNKGTRLELKNTSLDFISSGTGPINICTPYNSQGSISVEGECTFKSSTNNKLWLDQRVDLEIFSGSRLVLSPPTSLSIVPFN